MDALYEKIIRPLLFLNDCEADHDLALAAMKTVGAIPPVRAVMEWLNLVRTQKPVKVFGVKFPNRVGLAAGFDKDAHIWKSAAAFGFGHLELGTVTWHKQSGNAKPRMFRYPKSEAVVNSCGFPNDGAEAIGARLRASMGSGGKRKKFPVGINIGKSKITPLDEAAGDYLKSFGELVEFADFFVINVSSPNTPELRKLQGRDFLPGLLGAIAEANADRARKLSVKPVPIILKIAPDLSFGEVDSIISTVLELGLDGVAATNTTVSRPSECPNMEKSGGMSGRPLFEKSLEMVKYISKATGGKLPIIGVGGITDLERAGEMMNAGASLIQIYTGMIYRGPFFARAVSRALAWRDKEWV